MPTITSYLNGLSAGIAGRNLTPSKRGKVNGWSNAAVRRHTRWLYSIDAEGLDGDGWSGSLTMRDTPESSVAFHTALNSFVRRLKRGGATRGHWIVEWQTRGTPHVHLVCYWPGEETGLAPTDVGTDWPMWVTPSDQMPDDEGPNSLSQERAWCLPPADRRAEVVQAWKASFSAWTVGNAAQDAKPIYDSLGWLHYLSKHAGRGAAHYQRQGKPMGWESTGRLWGKWGDWPEVEPQRLEMSKEAYWELRRLARSWRVADARSNPHLAETGPAGRQARRRLVAARRMLQAPARELSEVRGLSEWIPEHVASRLFDTLMSRGNLLLEK